MIEFDFVHDCCGCSACIDICPRQCIQQTKDHAGFTIPKVDKSLCVDCHLCERVCPVLSPQHIKYDNRKLYSAINKDDEQRAAGSSGSIFYLLARSVIYNGGVVFGASFNDNLQLKHVHVDSMEDLKPLLKSKYLQSNTKDVYRQVKDALSKGRKVLFVGTPCQCNALYKFLGNKKPNELLLVDFICHGVPSQDLFDKSILLWEKKNKSKIEQFEFRHKRPDSVNYFYLKANRMNTDVPSFEVSDNYTNFPFYKMFKSHIGYRNSCYKCQFARIDRVSDITLADFWHIEELDEAVSLHEFNKGYSMVIVNSEKGADSMDSISDYVMTKEFPVNYAIKYNFAYSHSTIQPVDDCCFKLLYSIIPFCLLSSLFVGYSQSIFHRVLRKFLRLYFRVFIQKNN